MTTVSANLRNKTKARAVAETRLGGCGSRPAAIQSPEGRKACGGNCHLSDGQTPPQNISADAAANMKQTINPAPRELQALLKLTGQLVRLIEERQPATAQGERLLTHDQVAEVLAISRASLYKLLPRLKAKGLRSVEIGQIYASRTAAAPVRREGRPASTVRYTASSLARLLAKAAEKEAAL